MKKLGQSIFSFLFTLLVATSSSSGADESIVFKSEAQGFSFRYPSSWEPVAPQARTTVVLLYARNGSGATANVSVIPSDRSSAKEFDEAYFATALSKTFKGLKIKKVILKQISGRDVAFVEYDFVLSLPSQEVEASSLSMATVHEGRRYMLILNAPRSKLPDVRDHFEYMAGTFIFLP